MTVLSSDELRAGLLELDSWSFIDGAISTEFRFTDFRQAIAFVVRIGFEAEAANHHPDIDVRFNKVRLALSTHSAGGVTAKDLALASAIEDLAASWSADPMAASPPGAAPALVDPRVVP